MPGRWTKQHRWLKEIARHYVEKGTSWAPPHVQYGAGPALVRLMAAGHIEDEGARGERFLPTLAGLAYAMRLGLRPRRKVAKVAPISDDNELDDVQLEERARFRGKLLGD